MQTVIVMHPNDNVATALADLAQHQEILVRIGNEVSKIRVKGIIPFGHKLAIRVIHKGDNIIKYGEVMGRATQVIEPGEHAHIQNIESLRARGDLA